MSGSGVHGKGDRLSSSVEHFLIEEADMTRARRTQVSDRAATAYILQGTPDLMGTAAR
jgi:putative Holliday junction resolvase